MAATYDDGMISLIGYRGTGKTTVAKLLARRLNCEWADADVILEHQSKRTIADIFANEGESHFRELESNVLAMLIANGSKIQFVLATGGGVILSAKNRESLIGAGPVIWLTAPAEVIHQRITTDPTTGERRPDLTADGGLKEVETVLAARESLYRESASQTINTDGKSPDEIVDEIQEWLAKQPG